jgi:serine/threonine protein phosphatase PrpC
LLHETLDPIESLREAFDRTNSLCKGVLAKAQLLERRIGSTALVSVILQDKLYLANLGDSRAVLSRNGKAERLTSDHKPLTRYERKRIRDLGGNS